MAHRKTRPSHCLPIMFYVVKILSLVSSIVVAAIMAFFTYHLQREGFKLPWTFIVIMASSLVTLLNLAFTITLCCCHNRFLLLPLILNSTSLLLWGLSLGLLTWNMSGTLQHRCNNLNWGTDAGTMVCQIYKALYSFVVIGFVMQVAAVMLDIKTRRKQQNRGEYNAMRNDMILKNMKLNDRDSVASNPDMFENAADERRAGFSTMRPQPRHQVGQAHKYQTLSAFEQEHSSEAQQFSDPISGRNRTLLGGRRSDQHAPAPIPSSPMKMDEFNRYNAPEEQTSYDPVDYR